MKQGKVDLHIHTSASDGTWTAEEVVKKILENDIKIFAITDHNSVENVEKAKDLASEAGLILIPGVEVDTTYDGGNYHILGYGIDIYNEELLKLLSVNTKIMENKDEESIKFLERKGLNVSLTDYKKYENDNTRGGWKALNYLIDRGICKSTKDFFPLFDGWGNPFDKTEFPSPKEVIEVIKKAGGIPILAHPGAPFYRLEYDAIVPAMFKEGIMGIECYHPENNLEVTKFSIDFCKCNRLFITGGSDCHGTFFTHRSLGKPSIFYDNIVLEL
ncbi:PHP domain-containing protein [Lutispora thermophila]|uniref:Polymerase/histidinol phosphatase N-terminal domain-containing protein n=1 Tax=Lutispora thermophila DSM 19022 TaxID=1122184 RepID=A0A1M6D9I8_9FIRM|nr:PHP domain-containing protein [Lutispora thermophila]SHI69648.1 hypothetical protein SAMN02745176_01072 [Lutispora thermophila DSM 19022]